MISTSRSVSYSNEGPGSVGRGVPARAYLWPTIEKPSSTRMPPAPANWRGATLLSVVDSRASYGHRVYCVSSRARIPRLPSSPAGWSSMAISAVTSKPSRFSFSSGAALPEPFGPKLSKSKRVPYWMADSRLDRIPGSRNRLTALLRPSSRSTGARGIRGKVVEAQRSLPKPAEG